MNPIGALWMASVTALGVTVSAYAQDPSPREQFQAAVAAYQKSATEETAQKLAELVKKLDPPPAVPEEAEFRALKGAAFVKQAGNAAAFAKAAGEFQAAITAAPWVGEYHYNLAVCEKAAGRFGAANAALKLAKVFARDDKERKDILALRAELEAAQELAAAKTQDVDKLARAEAEKVKAKKAKTLIVPGVGIGEIQLGMLDSQVIAILGAPVNRLEFDNGGGSLEYSKLNVRLGRDKKVTLVGTVHRDFLTNEGVGVGTLMTEVSAAMGAPEKKAKMNYGPGEYWEYKRGIWFHFTTPGALLTVSSVSVVIP